MSARIGKTVTISCESDGNPEPTYTIYHNGTDKTSVISNEKTHTIHPINFSDAGSYRCEAKNELGNDLSEVKNLTVNGGKNSTDNGHTSPTPTNNTTTTPNDEGKIKNLSLSLVGLLFYIMYELSW